MGNLKNNVLIKKQNPSVEEGQYLHVLKLAKKIRMAKERKNVEDDLITFIMKLSDEVNDATQNLELLRSEVLTGLNNT